LIICFVNTIIYRWKIPSNCIATSVINHNHDRYSSPNLDHYTRIHVFAASASCKESQFHNINNTTMEQYVSRWVKPSPGTFKCNIDATFYSRKSSELKMLSNHGLMAHYQLCQRFRSAGCLFWARLKNSGRQLQLSSRWLFTIWLYYFSV
jgi:hypothetical protein